MFELAPYYSRKIVCRVFKFCSACASTPTKTRQLKSFA